MRSKLKRWRVRVNRKVETWIEVQAENALQAEALAATMPFVLNVFGNSALPGDRPVEGPIPTGILDLDDGW